MMDRLEQGELIALCQDLLAARSYSGEEKAVADMMIAFMRAKHFDMAYTDEYGNVLGCIRGKRPGRRILFDGHIDTVRADNAADWRHDPFAAELEDGRLYGRGAADMKGAVAAYLFAAERFARLTNRDFAGEIWVSGTVHEECFEGVSARKISAAVKPDLVVIGEASEMNIKCSQRGRAEICLETYGVPCHSANPEKGVNAVYAACRIIDRFRALPPVEQEGMFGKGILELTDIRSAPYPGASVVPHYCRVTFDRRLLVGETRESVLAPLQAVIDEMRKDDPTLRAKVSFTAGEEQCYTGAVIAADRFFPAWRVPADSDFVEAVCKAVCDMGYHPQLTGYSFCTNGSHYAGEAGIPCIGIGPGRENLAHTVDEYIELDELVAVSRYYTAVLNAVMDPAAAID